MRLYLVWNNLFLSAFVLYFPLTIITTSHQMSMDKHHTLSRSEDITIGFLAGYSQSKVILGAMSLAVEVVNNDTNLLPNRHLKFKPYNIGNKTETLRSLPIKIMTNMRGDNVVAFIGPDENCSSEALVAAAWNLPMISHKCTDPVVSDKTVFKTFARTLSPASKVSKSVISLLKAFGWHKFIIVTEAPSWANEVAKAIKDFAEYANLTVTDLKKYDSGYIPSNISWMEQIVDETYAITRIYVFVGDHVAMIDFIRSLQRRNLLQKGEYVVISVDDEIYDPARRSDITNRDYLDKYLGTETNIDLNSFQSVLKLTSYPSNTYFGEIRKNIFKYSRQEPFNVPLHNSISLSIPIYGPNLYDAVLIYARAATEVLANHGDIRDGTAIMDRIFNRSYNSVQGFDVHIDENGDAEGNYTVISLQDDLNGSTGSSHRKTMQPIGYFYYTSLDVAIPEFKYIDSTKQINWINGIPLAEPICGFDGELCKRSYWKFMIGGLFLVLIIAVAGAFFIKHYRYEQKLACLLWKVDMKELTLITTDNSDMSSVRTKGLVLHDYIHDYTAEIGFNINLILQFKVQTCRNSLINDGDTSKRAYTSIGIYRGNIVAIKRIHKRSIDLTRNIRKELKQMRDVHHENLISFIGASVDHGSVAILTPYCARGSLEHVLANEDLYLDQMFVSSLVSDILKGLIYLHDSEIISHGNLRSSNCLVDSRWVCQISDFGLHEFKCGQEDPNKAKRELKRNLWKPPELLRNIDCSCRGTQKGDVYSFGIVLYEIVGRNGPWGDTADSQEEIIHKLLNPNEPNKFYRPSLKSLDIPQYVRQCLESCWNEDPDDRPDIRLVRVKLKPMQSGLKPNIFDNMLAIMEKYAYNLEGLVQERTNQLYEEKKKTEALLLRMLPKTVADSLKRGDRVEAENFDCVTIFFSDLVGFTELCATSTPLEVVEMLNDLYTCCDSIISNYDVYKVETIGDAYMVVSGLPVKNGNRHAGEIASLALHLLDRVSKLEISHRAGELLQIRIGIHSGQCVAGVVGLKMPRYCLFGDTVNTASRMESTGEPLKIHISDATYRLLNIIGGFHCEERGLTFIKGKGDMQTYWLLSEDDIRVQNRFSMNDFNNVAPDLICDSELEQITSTRPIHRSLQLRQRGPSSYINLHTISNDFHTSKNYFCNLNCNDVKCNHIVDEFRLERRMRAGNDLDAPIYNLSSAINLINNESDDCKLCTYKLLPMLLENGNGYLHYEETRMPRSAPHITFVQ